jgi:integrase
VLLVRQLGPAFHVDLHRGDGTRIRGTLGTQQREAARRLAHRLETAIAEGPGSPLWPELRLALPATTYQRFAAIAGVRTTAIATWAELEQQFRQHLEQRVTLGKLAASTRARYHRTLATFTGFLAERRLCELRAVTRTVVEDYKLWRLAAIRKRKESRGGAGLVLDIAILHRCFAWAKERELVTLNPVKMEGRPGEAPVRGAQPFTAEALAQLRVHAGPDLLALLLLRWTGLRGSDAVQLTFAELDLPAGELTRLTQKRRKQVIVPLHPELRAALENEIQQRQPQPGDLVLLNPETRRPLTRPRLYQRLLQLGQRAGVPNAHPHRFRDTLAVDLLLRGLQIYDVAKILGDTVETVERHYAPFIPALRERVRALLTVPDSGLEAALSAK